MFPGLVFIGTTAIVLNKIHNFIFTPENSESNNQSNPTTQIENQYQEYLPQKIFEGPFKIDFPVKRTLDKAIHVSQDFEEEKIVQQPSKYIRLNNGQKIRSNVSQNTENNKNGTSSKLVYKFNNDRSFSLDSQHIQKDMSFGWGKRKQLENLTEEQPIKQNKKQKKQEKSEMEELVPQLKKKSKKFENQKFLKVPFEVADIKPRKQKQLESNENQSKRISNQESNQEKYSSSVFDNPISSNPEISHQTTKLTKQNQKPIQKNFTFQPSTTLFKNQTPSPLFNTSTIFTASNKNQSNSLLGAPSISNPIVPPNILTPTPPSVPSLFNNQGTKIESKANNKEKQSQKIVFNNEKPSKQQTTQSTNLFGKPIIDKVPLVTTNLFEKLSKPNQTSKPTNFLQKSSNTNQSPKIDLNTNSNSASSLFSNLASTKNDLFSNLNNSNNTTSLFSNNKVELNNSSLLFNNQKKNETKLQSPNFSNSIFANLKKSQTNNTTTTTQDNLFARPKLSVRTKQQGQSNKSSLLFTPQSKQKQPNLIQTPLFGNLSNKPLIQNKQPLFSQKKSEIPSVQSMVNIESSKLTQTKLFDTALFSQKKSEIPSVQSMVNIESSKLTQTKLFDTGNKLFGGNFQATKTELPKTNTPTFLTENKPKVNQQTFSLFSGSSELKPTKSLFDGLGTSNQSNKPSLFGNGLFGNSSNSNTNTPLSMTPNNTNNQLSSTPTPSFFNFDNNKPSNSLFGGLLAKK